MSSNRLREADAGALWTAVDGLLERASVEGVLAHKLGPLAAVRLRRQGKCVPARLEAEERLARAAFMTAIPLLGRVRDVTDGPLLVVKGPEAARLYPDRARSFFDVDLLTADGHGVHAALKKAGFAEVDDPELFRDHHHLRPLQAEGLWLKVEIHLRPMLPHGVPPPPVDEIVEAAVPSTLGIEGISAPDPVHHALMLAAHAWVHEPLHTLRDLIDVAAVAELADDEELGRTARSWGIERIWRTNQRAADALFGAAPTTPALRIFGRHLEGVRERTVLDNHLQRWLHSFWELPFSRALLATRAALRQAVLPEPGESWRDKLVRVRHAVLHPGRPMSLHTAGWRRDLDRDRPSR
jgi:hypothetical protein